MATNVNINHNYGEVTVIDNMVQLPGNRQMPIDEYEELMVYESSMKEQRHNVSYKLSDSEQIRIAIEQTNAKLDKLIELLSK